MKKVYFLYWLLVTGLLLSPHASAQEELPTSFTMDAQGSLTCNGISEDACAYFDEIQTPGGVLYLVQGSYSRHPDAHDARKNNTDYVNVYFAFLCEKNENTLSPVFNFLEGRERVSDVHLYDLDSDGTSEIIVTAAFDSRGSYAAVYRLREGKPIKIFDRRANTPNTDFEVREGVPVLMMWQRTVRPNGSLGAMRQENFEWNGKEFVAQS
jgi:hypothetical protein